MMKADMLPSPNVIRVSTLVTATKIPTHTVNIRLTVPIEILHSTIYDIIVRCRNIMERTVYSNSSAAQKLSSCLSQSGPEPQGLP